MGRGEGRRVSSLLIFFFSFSLPFFQWSKEEEISVTFSFPFIFQTKKLSENLKPERELCVPCRTAQGLEERFRKTDHWDLPLVTLILRVNVRILQLLVLSVTTRCARQDLTIRWKIKARNGLWCILLPAMNWCHFGPPSRGEKPAYRNREKKIRR